MMQHKPWFSVYFTRPPPKHLLRGPIDFLALHAKSSCLTCSHNEILDKNLTWMTHNNEKN